MKKSNLKLALKKSIVAQLSKNQMSGFAGGSGDEPTHPNDCTVTFSRLCPSSPAKCVAHNLTGRLCPTYRPCYSEGPC